MAVKVKNIIFLEEVLTIHALLSQYTRLTDWEWEYTSKIITLVLDSQILRDHNFWSASLREETSSFILLSSAFSDFNSEIGFLCYSFMLCSSLGTLVSHQNSVVLPEPDVFSRADISCSASTIWVLCFKMELQSQVKFAIVNS